MGVSVFFTENAPTNEAANKSSDQMRRWSGHSCSKHRYLNELVKGHFVNDFSGFNTQYSEIVC